MSAKRSTQIISRETINRLIKDITYINKNPLHDNNIYYQHDEEDMMKGYAMIIGPEDTPYQYGYYFFELIFPVDFPHSPPIVHYKTNGDKIRFNPNLYTNEKVCISILNTWSGEAWSSCQTITTILLTLCTLLCKDPLLNEPGVNTNNKDFNNYTKIIEYKNIEIAILKMIQKDTSVFPVQFERFHLVMEEQFAKNRVAILNFVEKKISEQTQESELVMTGIYGMRCNINYSKILAIILAIINL